MSRHPAITTNDECRSCGAHVVWGYCGHKEGCPDADALSSPADLAHKEGFAQVLRCTFGIADASDPRVSATSRTEPPS